MSPRTGAAIAVHLLTAFGAVCGLLALHYAAAQNWSAAFLWMGAALLIDGADGPLARILNIDAVLPRFSGVSLDETIDYLNYCVVPAFVFLESGLLGDWRALFVASLIVLVSLFHFADRSSKTPDGYFVGFPALWNVVCFYVFAFALNENATLALVVVLALLTFVPVKWVHPLRVRRLRALTVAVVTCWAAAAAFTVIDGFPAKPFVQVILIVSALYALALGISRTVMRNTEKGG